MLPRRLERLKELLHQEISRIILELKDPGIAFVTVTGVEIMPDLELAQVFYSVLGTDEECENTKRALKRAASYIRHELGKLENLRRVPEIRFVYDDTPARAARVFELLNQIEQEKATRPATKVRPRNKKIGVQKNYRKKP